MTWRMVEFQLLNWTLLLGFQKNNLLTKFQNSTNKGRSVLIALGGADAHVELETGDERAFADEIIRHTERYGLMV